MYSFCHSVQNIKLNKLFAKYNTYSICSLYIKRSIFLFFRMKKHLLDSLYVDLLLYGSQS